MNAIDIIFYVLLLLVSFLYATVGHGGASGYLALMVFFSYTPESMKSTALILNICVSFISFVHYYKNSHFKWSLFWPFIVLSIPAAYIGGLMKVDDSTYKKILAILLLFPIYKLIVPNKNSNQTIKNINLTAAILIGGGIGYVSGLIGIGGGIILSPVILLLHWANFKETAASSALFIFVNSIAGMLGLYTKGFSLQPDIAMMLIIAVLGGTLGAYMGAKKFDSVWLRRILAFVLVLASIKLFNI